VDGSLYLSSLKTGTALCLRIIGSMYHCHISICILLTAGALYKISAHQADFISGEHAEIFLRRLFHKVLSLNIKLTAKGNLTAAKLRIFQIVRHIQLFHLTLRIIVDHQLYRVKHSHHTGFFKL